jgi:hypothetical protein
MRPRPTMLAVTAVLAMALAACGQGTSRSTNDEATPDPTATAAPAGDPCAELEGGEELAFLFVTSPTTGQSVSSGFEVTGCGNVFEATYQWELLDTRGEVLTEDFGTASCGTGCVGDLSFTVDFDVDKRQVGTLRVFAESARDGSDTHVHAVPLILEP